MVSLLKESHAFTVAEVIAEYEDRLDELAIVADNEGNETAQSKIDRFKSYDVFEINDLLLSRMVVESLLTSTFREKIDTRFSHLK